jgi:hypothetical protein
MSDSKTIRLRSGKKVPKRNSSPKEPIIELINEKIVSNNGLNNGLNNSLINSNSNNGLTNGFCDSFADNERKNREFNVSYDYIFFIHILII